MKNLQRLAQECLREADAIGIKYGHIVEIKVNTRAVGWLGITRRKADGYHIEISDMLLPDWANDVDIKSTIMHEILHTVHGCMNHGPKWKQLAEYTMRFYPYDISVKGSLEDYYTDAEIYEIMDKKSKYIFYCRKCGKMIYKNRMCDFVRHPQLYKHDNCEDSDIVRIR